MSNEIKAIIIPGNANASDNRPRAFVTFAGALTFLRTIKSATVIVEFSVESDTLDFYDAVKGQKALVIFSTNPLGPLQFSQLGIRGADIVYPESPKQVNRFADYRPRPGIRVTALTPS